MEKVEFFKLKIVTQEKVEFFNENVKFVKVKNY